MADPSLLSRRQVLHGSLMAAGLTLVPLGVRPRPSAQPDKPSLAKGRPRRIRRLVHFKPSGTPGLVAEVRQGHHRHVDEQLDRYLDRRQSLWHRITPATAEAQFLNFALDPIYVIEVAPQLNPTLEFGFNPQAYSPTFGGTYESWGSYAGLVYLYDEWMSGRLTAQYGVKPPPWLQAQMDADAARQRQAQLDAQAAQEALELERWIQNPELAFYGGRDAAIVARQMEKQGLHETEVVALIATLQAAATIIDAGYLFTAAGLKAIGEGIAGGTIMLSLSFSASPGMVAAGVGITLMGVGLLALGIYGGYWLITNLGYPVPIPQITDWSVTPYVDLTVEPPGPVTNPDDPYQQSLRLADENYRDPNADPYQESLRLYNNSGGGE